MKGTFIRLCRQLLRPDASTHTAGKEIKSMLEKSISLMRATPPHLPELSRALQTSWKELQDPKCDLAWEFRQHRYSGTEEDRLAAVDWIGTRIEPAPSSDRLMVTNGTMNSILLLSSTIVGAGNVLLVEELTFPQVYTLAELVGVRVVGVRIDGRGIVPEDFERKCRELSPKAIYLNCSCHSPTAYVTPMERRLEIVEVARRYGVQIFEDEAQVHYLENAPPSFASLSPESTWYMMGLSKYLSLGVRMAYVVAPTISKLQELMSRIRPLSSWHPAPLVAVVITRWMQLGIAQNLLLLGKAEVQRRQAAVVEVLGDIPGFRTSGGIHFWLQCPQGTNSEDFSAALGEAGVTVRPSKLYSGPKAPSIEGIRPGVGDPADVAETQSAADIIRSVYERYV
ncbi:PLP-dependent aminotransferase family protein [Sinorhizobium meliloti]|nr:PLP-dependent aminotransferase family protein [Sinorhizobium meliloti]